MTTLDARGLSCPEPVIMIQKAMKTKEAAYVMIVDNHASKENVTRFAEKSGYQVSVNESNGEYTLEMRKLYDLFCNLLLPFRSHPIQKGM